LSDYDFKTLNDKEFEILSADLLSIALSRKFERFKPGKDAGVDGRYFTDDGKEVILQCKHWASTPIAQLISSLKNIELPKLNKLKPSRYILSISLPLSRKDKKEIATALGSHLSSQSDIFGREDLNDILRVCPEIEQNHYKLWLHSASVLAHILHNAILGRSSYSLEEIRDASCRYVVTSNHERAMKMLNDAGVVIITGEPGIGKSTLAEHLCVHYAAQGYSYLKIGKEISEAEAIFTPDTKQIFYFDDFLGRNYLEALSGHEGSEITQFIRRVSKNPKKRFVLTSRSTIINQGKLLIDQLQHSNLEKKEYEIRIDSLSELDRAKILYNHIWHSQLTPGHIDELYQDHRYRKVISHRNYNPRLISYVTDSTRLEDESKESYWPFVERSLSNPAQVWENPFVAQQDDFGRVLILLVVLHGNRISEADLSSAYHDFLSLPSSQTLKGRSDFQTNIRTLTGSFFNRYINVGGPNSIDLFNPSIGDFVLSRYAQDTSSLTKAFICLQTMLSLLTLTSLMRTKIITNQTFFTIIQALVRRIVEKNFEGITPTYAAELFSLYITSKLDVMSNFEQLKSIACYVLNKYTGTSDAQTFLVAEWALRNNIISDDDALIFAQSRLDDVQADDEITNFWKLLDTIPKTTKGHATVTSNFKTALLSNISENLTEFVEPSDAFSQCDYGDYDEATQHLLKLIESKLDDLGIPTTDLNISDALDSFDIEQNMNKYFENQFDDRTDDYNAPSVDQSISEIDDLFDRG